MRPWLLDINVFLDALLERPEGSPAVALWAEIERRRHPAMIPAHGVTTLHYLLGRARGAAFARSAVRQALAVFGVAAVDGAVIRAALASGWADFEDAVCAAAAEAAGCSALITRDPAGFRRSALPVWNPATALARLQSGRE